LPSRSAFQPAVEDSRKKSPGWPGLFRSGSALPDRQRILDDLGGHEDQQLGLVLDALGLAGPDMRRDRDDIMGRLRIERLPVPSP
jgi:hypothetical protein